MLETPPSIRFPSSLSLSLSLSLPLLRPRSRHLECRPPHLAPPPLYATHKCFHTLSPDLTDLLLLPQHPQIRLLTERVLYSRNSPPGPHGELIGVQSVFRSRATADKDDGIPRLSAEHHDRSIRIVERKMERPCCRRIAPFLTRHVASITKQSTPESTTITTSATDCSKTCRRLSTCRLLFHA